ncbi:MAG: hypothetical protein ACFFA5_05135 [Promethearchaeota archaeon]
MRGVHRKLLISLLAMFVICLIVSPSTTIVTDKGEWGTLKPGDVMEWQSTHYKPPYVIKILNVEGDIITIEWQRGASIFVWKVHPGSDISNFYLHAQSYYSGFKKTNYEWKNTTYKAYYSKHIYFDGSYSEFWEDVNTGIMFEWRDTDRKGRVFVRAKLISSTADMAEITSGGVGCLGTLFVALFSVSSVFSYGLVRFWKRKKPI